MKWKLVCCVILLACMILQAMPVLAATGTTTVTGTISLVTSEVSVANITTSSTTISWKTNGDATSQVFYDTQFHDDIADYAYHTDEDATLVSEHSIPLSGLASSTTYHYRVRSAIPDTEFIAISEDYTFTTSSSACFIATAAYGTSTAEQINILREFRDEVLLPNKVGAAFVSFYYRVSPPIADFISRHEVLRTIVKEGFVDPLVVIVRFSQSLWGEPINRSVLGGIIAAVVTVGVVIFFWMRRRVA